MQKQKNISEEVGSLGALLRRPYQELQEYVYDALAAQGFADIRPAYSSVFRYILPEGSRAIDLAERAQITKQSMAYLLESLHERGYIEYIPDPDDGRAKLACLTRRGQQFVESAVRVSADFEAEMAARMADGEMKELRRLLEKLNDSLSETKGS